MNRILFQVRIKDRIEHESIMLFHKIYSTPEGIIHYWSTNVNSMYRLEIKLDENNLTAYPQNIIKDLKIIDSEEELAEKFMSKYYEYRFLQLQKV